MRVTRLCRVVVFAERTWGRRRKPSGVAWVDWNADRRMERRAGRLRGSGSFDWPTPRAAWRRAKVILAADPSVHQLKVETISGRTIGRLFRGDRAYAVNWLDERQEAA